MTNDPSVIPNEPGGTGPPTHNQCPSTLLTRRTTPVGELVELDELVGELTPVVELDALVGELIKRFPLARTRAIA